MNNDFNKEFNRKQWNTWNDRREKAQEKVNKFRSKTAVKKWNREVQVCRMMMRQFEEKEQVNE